jgi:methyl-accepting chemotaxis protein
MSVARRAVIGFTVVFLVAVSSCTVVFFEAKSSARRLADYRVGSQALDGTMWSIRSDFYNYDDQMNMYVAVLAGGDSKEQLELAETTYQQGVEAHDRLGKDLDRAAKLAQGAKLKGLVTRLKKDFTGYNGFADQTRVAARAGDIKKAIYLSTVGNLEPSNDMMPTLDAASAEVRKTVDAELSELDGQQRLLEKVAAASGGVIALLIALLAAGMRFMVLRPVEVLRAGMSDIATGRRSRNDRIEMRGNDEFSQVGDAFNLMLEALAEQDAELQRQTAARETQLQAGYEQQRAAEQMVRTRAQSVVDETASTVADDLREVMQAVMVVRDAANTIDDKVNTADQVTRSVVANAKEADRVVADLETSLRRVAGMTELIAGVADQTKLLALNATIEAARAGEAGRGFSVVADEVKQLAMTTATSTGEIVATIASLERDAAAMTAAISAMSEGLTGVDEATGVLKQVAEQQHALVSQLDDKVGETIEKINGMATLAERLERRAHQRVPMDQNVRLRGPVGVYEGQFGDLSEGGMLATCTRAPGLTAGTVIDVEFELRGERFSQRGQVVTPPPNAPAEQVRLQFVGPAPALVKAIRAMTGETADLLGAL